jgi:hypothetical protein
MDILINISIVLAAFVIAVIGIYTKPEGNRSIQVVLTVSALVVATAGVVKAILDEGEKERLQEARIGPSAASMKRLEIEIDNFAKQKGYLRTQWFDVGDGLSFFLESGPQTGAIVFNKHDLGRLIQKGVTTEIPKLIAEHTSGEYGLANTSYDEDVYNRIAIVCAGAVQQLKQVSRPEWFKDQDYGVRVDFPESDGKRSNILVTPKEIASVPKSPMISYFGSILQLCRQKLN